jgi:hypothetical protein
VPENTRQCWGFLLGNFYLPKKFIIPAKAGIQYFVYSITWNGLVPGLRREDRFLEVAYKASAGGA